MPTVHHHKKQTNRRAPVQSDKTGVQRGRGFSQRQRAFIREYLVDLEPRQAAIRAGYAKGVAHSTAYYLLHRHPTISKLIKKEMDARAERCKVTADWVLAELKREYDQLKAMNEASHLDIRNPDGSIKNMDEWPDIWLRKDMVSSITVDGTYDAVLEAFALAAGKSKRRLTSTYMIDVQTHELKKEQLKTLERIGRHVGVGAFKDDASAILDGDIKLQVVYIDTLNAKQPEQLRQITPKPNGHATTEPEEYIPEYTEVLVTEGTDK